MASSYRSSGTDTDEENRTMIDVTIGFTTMASKKQSSFLDKRWMKVEFKRMLESNPSSVEVWSKGRFTSEFHLRLPSENYTAVFIDEIDHFVIITQMHDHPDYHDDPVFEKLDDEWFDNRFGNRVPASEAPRSNEEAMDIEVLGTRNHGATRGDR